MIFYLDPHKVSKQTSKEEFHCTDYRAVSLSDIDRPVGFCFYLRNIQDITKLKDLLITVKSKHSDDMPFGFEESIDHQLVSCRVDD